MHDAKKLIHANSFGAFITSHWYVSGYCLSFPNPANEEMVESLLTDVTPESTMFRIVVKSNLDSSLAQHLANHIEEIVPVLSRMENGINNITSQKEMETIKSSLRMENSMIPEDLEMAVSSMKLNANDEEVGSAVAKSFDARKLLRKAGRMQIISYNMAKKKSVGRNSFSAC